MEGDTEREELRQRDILRRVADGKRLGGDLPLIAAAIKCEETGYVTLGGDHMDCRLHAYRIETGDYRKLKWLLKENTAFDQYLRDNEFIDGFVNCILEFFTRAEATQIVGRKRKLDKNITELHSSDVFKIGNEPGVHSKDILDL